MKYRVGDIRAAGLKCRWTRTKTGAPIIAGQREDTGKWYVINSSMWDRSKVVGLKQAFEEHTCLAEFFSIPA